MNKVMNNVVNTIANTVANTIANTIVNRALNIRASNIAMHIPLFLLALSFMLALQACGGAKIEFVSKDFHGHNPKSTIAILPVIQASEIDSFSILPTWLDGENRFRSVATANPQVIHEANVMMYERLKTLYPDAKLLGPEYIDSVLSSTPEKKSQRVAMNFLQEKLHPDAFVVLHFDRFFEVTFNSKNGSSSSQRGSDDITCSLFNSKAELLWLIHANCMLGWFKPAEYNKYIETLFSKQLDDLITELNSKKE